MKAYRQLAVKWHPDKYEGEDKKLAEKNFIDIAAAKEVLTDPGKFKFKVWQLRFWIVFCLEKRSKFDNGEDPLDAEEQAQQNQGFHGFQGFNPFESSGFQFKFNFN